MFPANEKALRRCHSGRERRVKLRFGSAALEILLRRIGQSVQFLQITGDGVKSEVESVGERLHTAMASSY